MGTSRETCPANTALVTMMAASALDQGLPEGYSKAMRLAAALKFTFLTGVFQIGLGIFRLGAIVHYVSHPVMVATNSAGRCDCCSISIDSCESRSVGPNRGTNTHTPTIRRHHHHVD